MRGNEKQQSGMFSYVSMEERVPADHPLRPTRQLVDQILTTMSKRFDDLYAENGRPSIPPERLLRALLLQICRVGFRGFIGLRQHRAHDEPVQRALFNFSWKPVLPTQSAE